MLTTLTAPDGTQFRDLNRNGRMDPYEDPRLPTGDRVADLLGRMTLGEKVGQMFQTLINVGPDGTLVEDTTMGLWVPNIRSWTLTRGFVRRS